MSTLCFGIIGSAHGHINCFINDMLNAGYGFKGVFNDGTDNAKIIAEHYNVPLFDNVDSLFEQGIEIAGTSAVNNKKIDIIEACAEHRVHIMADKPIVTDEDQYKRLVKVIASKKSQVGLMLTTRFIPSVYTLKKLIDKGVIGKLLSVEILNPHKLTPSLRPEWHFDKKQNGGIAVDLHIHSIDLFDWLTGSTISEYSGIIAKSILKEKQDFYDFSCFTVLSRTNVAGYFRVDWHIPEKHWSWGDLRIFCTGSKGIIEVRAVGDPVTRQQQVILYGIDTETGNIEIDAPDKTETTDFIERINGRNSIITHDDMLEATRLSIEFTKSAKVYRL